MVVFTSLGERPAAGLRRTAGAGQKAGRDTVARIRALPLAENRTGAVVAASVPLQYSDAARSGTGLARVVMSTRPCTSTRRRPLLPRRTCPRVSRQGAPPDATPKIAGSAGTLGVSTARSSSPRVSGWPARPEWLAAAALAPTSPAVASAPAATPTDDTNSERRMT